MPSPDAAEDAAEVLAALARVSTSRSWSGLDAVVAKAARVLGTGLVPRDVAKLLAETPAAELAARGIWVHSFGPAYAPLVAINTACARARSAGPGCCTCGAAPAAGKGEAVGRFFGSQDYNAGRHAPANSAHRGNCAAWEPPAAGHLHSWRRSFKADGSIA